MRLETVVRDGCIKVGAAYGSKDEALRDVASLAAGALAGAATAGAIFDALKAREAVCSTGFGKGLAIPHCRLPDIRDFIVGAVSVPEGVDFAALDGQPVRLIIFLIGPESAQSDHIHLLSAIARAFRDRPDEIDHLVALESVASFHTALDGLDHAELDVVGDENKALFHVFVQDDEDLFLDVLEMFAALDATSVTVVDTRESGDFLQRLPLYMGLFGAGHSSFSRLVLAVVDAKLCNELVRRIETRTGPLRECPHVMVTIQQLFFAAGALGY